MRTLLIVLALFGSTAVAAASDWFDMENCGVCKAMADNTDLMHQLTWENHMLPNGTMSILVVPAELKDAVAKTHAKMEAAIEDLKNGEQMELCGCCESFGELLSMGADKQEIDTAMGRITLITSDDPEVVKKIHAHMKKSMDEHEKIAKAHQAS